MSTDSKFVFISAKWSEDIGAYVASINGKVAIIDIEPKGAKAVASKVPSLEAKANPKSKPEVAKKSPIKRKRAKSLTEEENALATELIQAGNSLDEVQMVIPGVVKNIFQRLKRELGKPGKKSKAPKKSPKGKLVGKK